MVLPLLLLAVAPICVLVDCCVRSGDTQAISRLGRCRNARNRLLCGWQWFMFIAGRWVNWCGAILLVCHWATIS